MRMSSVRRCCASCFGDRLIRNEYIKMCEPVTQDCDFCGAGKTDCIEPSQLREWFSALLSTYQECADGDPLVKLLDEEWHFFHGSGLDFAGEKELLAEVLNDGEIVRKMFAKVENRDEGSLNKWEDLRDELMHKNRWFLQKKIDLEGIGKLLSDHLITLQATLDSSKWYRARLIDSQGPHTLNQMGAPPVELAKHGRANPVGIPYLYLASTAVTAVAELRPHTGEHASVAEFDLARPELKFADLRDPRGYASPLLDDENAIYDLRAGLPLLERLGEELTRPVKPSSAPYEYIPTQYLCEYIKTCGFDGVLYRSSVSVDGGVNIALFKPEVARPLSVKEVEVSQVIVNIGDNFS